MLKNPLRAKRRYARVCLRGAGRLGLWVACARRAGIPLSRECVISSRTISRTTVALIAVLAIKRRLHLLAKEILEQESGSISRGLRAEVDRSLLKAGTINMRHDIIPAGKDRAVR